ncbi:DNA polymerase III [Treponema sp. R6D11]
MFENIIEQGAVLQLQNDILSQRLAPSMLFYGPSESGKGSSALELARILSCEKDASWKCECPSCEKHRYLQHVDLLMLGPRSFAAEIFASCSTFWRNPAANGPKKLFIRSLRKLQMRFSPVLMEEDPKLSKLSSTLQSFEEGLSDLWLTNSAQVLPSALEKQCTSLVKTAQTLIEDGIGGTIPIDHIRKAAYWCRLAPTGKRKTLIIENAENMREEARNSLLKLLEEPPETVSIVLTTQRREAIMPTILSRLRPYRFVKRSEQGEREVIRRVFQDTVKEESLSAGGSIVSAYLDSFLPAGAEKLYPLAAWFIVSLARAVTSLVKKDGTQTPKIINVLGQRYAPIANEAGFERTVDAAAVVKTLLEKSSNFENDSISRFFEICLDMVCDAAREADDPEFIVYRDIFRKRINETETAVNTLNISAALALEGLFYSLKNDMVKPYGNAYG